MITIEERIERLNFSKERLGSGSKCIMPMIHLFESVIYLLQRFKDIDENFFNLQRKDLK